MPGLGLARAAERLATVCGELLSTNCCETLALIVSEVLAPRRRRFALGRVFRLVEPGEPRAGRGQHGRGGLEVGLLHPLDGGPQVRGRLVLVSQAELVAADQA